MALIAGAIGLFLVGIFTENAGRIHYYVSALTFLATPLAYVLFGIDWLRHGEKLIGLDDCRWNYCLFDDRRRAA